MHKRRDPRKFRWGRLAGIAGLFLSGGVVSGAPAEDEGAAYARVRDLDGSVTVVRAAEGTVLEGTLNTPVTPGDKIWTDDGRVEIELADWSLIWMDHDSRANFRNLTDIGGAYGDANLVALEQGAIRISTHDPADDDRAFQIDTEAGTIFLLSGGSFRIDTESGTTTLSSFRGVAELSGDGGSILVRSGERSSVGIGRAPIEPRHFNTLRFDEFDRYCEERALVYLQDEESGVPEGVAEEIPAEVNSYVNELSVYGSWYSVPSYGWVWRPVYGASWAPYVDGHWTWCASGWSWVSYEPWGWAPYHYGRWDHVADIGWFWIPGRRWSGAWVSFAVGAGYVGWSPLNYYNRPVFHDHHFDTRVTVNVYDLHPRGWHYTKTEDFGAHGHKRAVLRGDLVPRDTQAVITRRLPHFDPLATAKRPERAARLVDEVRASREPLPAGSDAKGRPVSFRKLELDVDPRPGIKAPGRSRKFGQGGEPLRRAPRVQALTLDDRPVKRSGERAAQPAAPSNRGSANPDRTPGRGGDHAVKQLIRGSRKAPSSSTLPKGGAKSGTRVGPATGSTRAPGRNSTGASRGTSATGDAPARDQSSARAGAKPGAKASGQSNGQSNGNTRSVSKPDPGQSGNDKGRSAASKRQPTNKKNSVSTPPKGGAKSGTQVGPATGSKRAPGSKSTDANRGSSATGNGSARDKGSAGPDAKTSGQSSGKKRQPPGGRTGASAEKKESKDSKSSDKGSSSKSGRDEQKPKPKPKKK